MFPLREFRVFGFPIKYPLVPMRNMPRYAVADYKRHLYHYSVTIGVSPATNAYRNNPISRVPYGYFMPEMATIRHQGESFAVLVLLLNRHVSCSP